MQSVTKQSEKENLASMLAVGKAPDIASASVSDALAAFHVNPDTGLTGMEVDARRKENGYNEVAKNRGNPVIDFLRKFWGISAGMLELIMVPYCLLSILFRSILLHINY